MASANLLQPIIQIKIHWSKSSQSKSQLVSFKPKQLSLMHTHMVEAT